MKQSILGIIEKYQRDPSRIMDILIDIQAKFGYIPEEHNQMISDQLGISRADLQQTMSFYHFFSQNPRGTYTVYLNNSVTSEMMLREEVQKTLLPG